MLRGPYRSRSKRDAAPEAPEKSARELAIEQQQRDLFALKRALKVKRARNDLRNFIELMWPDPEYPDDPDHSLFDCEPHHKILIEMVEKIERRELMRAGCSMPPQHGKSLILSRFGLAWILGRNPHLRVLFATYNDKLAETRGDELRTVLEAPAFREVFPKAALKRGSRSKSEMVFQAGGSINLIGRGSGATGRPADLFLIDDPYKDSAEADSDTIREDVRNWYSGVVQTRCPAHAPILIVHCMTGDTPVLRADGSETPLRDIRPGDEIATYRDGALSTSVVRNWVNQGPDRVFAIKTTSGTIVKANARHPFLVRVDGEQKWVKTSDLRPGHEIVRVSGASGRVKPARRKGVASWWFAADTALRTTTRSVGQTAFGLLQLTASLVGPRTLNIGTESLRRITGALTPSRAAFALSANSLPGRTFAHIGAASFASTTATVPEKSALSSVTTAISRRATSKQPRRRSVSPSISAFTLDRIEEISPAGIEDVFDIEVAETENFIANGLVSHNTRWNEDDLLGWLCDKEHPSNLADPKRAVRWKYVNLPTPVNDDHMAQALGLPVGSALWPKRFPLEHLEAIRSNDERLYAALYLGEPAPLDGDFFKAEHWHTYLPHELPKKLRYYSASDHGLSEKTRADPTVMGTVGVCEQNIVWVLGDLFWDRVDAQKQAEAMLAREKRRPSLWWRAGRDHITGSIGPFLRRRMLETNTFINLIEEPEKGDKVSKAQAIQARMAAGAVRFPAGAPWLMKARTELLKFPHAKHDDFVDFLSLIGRGLRAAFGAPRLVVANDDKPKTNTLAWIKNAAKIDREAGEHRKRIASL
jgi:hypothetical protein